MKKNSSFFAIAAFIFLFFATFLSAEQQKGRIECENLLYFLQKNGYQAMELPILPNTESDFPFNIKLDFFPDNYDFSENSGTESEEITTLALIFQIEEISENYKFLLKMLDSIKNYSRNGKIQLIFTYGDKFGFGSTNILAGTESFAEQLEDEENSAVICISLKNKMNAVIPGSGGDCSPAWLLKLVADGFYSNNLFYIVKGGFITSLHRGKILKSNPAAAVFMEKGIPACAVELSTQNKSEEYSKKIANFIGEITFNFEPENTIEWDRNSKLLAILNIPFIISEKLTIILFIIVSGVSLFLLCEFSFMPFFSKRLYSRHVSKKIFIIPLCIFITTASFFTGQYVAYGMKKLLEINIIACYSIKIFFAFLFTSLSYFMVFKIQKNHSAVVYSFLINITGIFNIFLFTTLDISLFYIFAAEYIIILLTQKIKRTVSLAFLFFALFLPFIPFMLQLLSNASDETLSKILMASVRTNIVFSFAFLPFELVWFRLLTRLNSVWKDVNKEKKVFIKQNIIAISLSFAIFGIILVCTCIFLPEKYKLSERKTFSAEEISSPSQIQIFYDDSKFLGDTTRTFTVHLENSSENVKIELQGADGNPILYTDELYSYIAKSNTAVFQIPAWPPLEMTFSYIADTSQNAIIKVSEFVNESNGNFKIFTNSIEIPGKKQE